MSDFLGLKRKGWFTSRVRVTPEHIQRLRSGEIVEIEGRLVRIRIGADLGNLKERDFLVDEESLNCQTCGKRLNDESD